VAHRNRSAIERDIWTARRVVGRGVRDERAIVGADDVVERSVERRVERPRVDRGIAGRPGVVGRRRGAAGREERDEQKYGWCADHVAGSSRRRGAWPDATTMRRSEGIRD
jgi:hypothetical protein